MSTASRPTVASSTRLFLPTSSLLDGALDPALNYPWAGFACLVVFIIFSSARTRINYKGIPAVGRTGFVTSYLDALQYMKRGSEFVAEGYAKYRHGAFRVPELKCWHILVSGPKLTDELRKASDDVLSATDAVRDRLSTDWTLAPLPLQGLYHISIIKNQLTRNLGNLFSDLREETVLAFDEYIPPTEEWTKVRALDTMMKVVSRATNRIFVGAPTCRDPEYTALNVRFTVDVVIAGNILSIFPNFLKPIAGRLFTNVPKSGRVAFKHLAPVIEERKRKIEEYGRDYPDKPPDVLSWFMDEGKDEELTTERLTLRILTLNFAAIHTSSMTFTTALYELACRPEYMQPIREEVEAMVYQYGWTKMALTHMRKLDSFIKETQRLMGLDALTMTRKALTDYTFSDGTHVPKGAFVSAVATAHHLDEDVYPDATTFDGFRFSEIREEEGEGTKNQMVATSLDHLAFGHGKHACPGRFFAANEVKGMMAHVVLTYDLMMTAKQQPTWFGTARVPDRNAEVLFRKRRL